MAFQKPKSMSDATHTTGDNIPIDTLYNGSIPFVHENQINDNSERMHYAIERFSHACTHEFKEPLRNAANFIQLLIYHNQNQFDEQSLRFASHIHQSIDRMHALTKSLAYYLKIIESNASITTKIDMNYLIASLQKVLQNRLLEKNAIVTTETLPIVHGVYDQLYQLFFNLLDNAIKFSTEKPLCIEIFTREDKHTVTFHVRDNGIGIETKYHAYIFHMFNRLHDRKSYDGFGTGLAICKEIIQKHRGKIDVQSIPEQGSEFIITLPKV